MQLFTDDVSALVLGGTWIFKRLLIKPKQTIVNEIERTHMVLLVMYYSGSKIGCLTGNNELYSMAVSRSGGM